MADMSCREHRDGFAQRARLLRHRLRGRRRLFDERRVLLRDFVHLRDGLIDLLDARALFVRRRRNLGCQTGS